MKLYYDPISTTARPVLLFAGEEGIDLDLEYVELHSTGPQMDAYLALNPNGIVPYLVDGAFETGESSAILKYLADKVGSPAYPTELMARARVNAAMDWFATNLQRDFCTFLAYPQLGVFAEVGPEGLQAMVAYGHKAAPRWLKILDERMIGDDAFVCGGEITLADYLGSAFVTLGEPVGFDFSPYPNIRRWLGRMKALPSWGIAYAAFNGWMAAHRPHQAGGAVSA